MKCRLGTFTVALMAWCGQGYAAGGAGVGITSPPCGIDKAPPFPPCVFPFDDCEGNHPNYESAILTFNDRINTDLDILYSSSFQEFASRDPMHPGWPVTPAELQDLATQIDGNPNAANPLGSDYQNKWDVELIFNYYTHGSSLYSGFGPISNFRFDNSFLQQEPLETERNHADVYLVPLFEFVNEEGCIASIGTGGYGCCRTEAGRVTAIYTDDDEDFPFSTGPMAEQCPPGTNVPEFHDNSMQIWDHFGNYASVPNWQQASTVTFDHEFEHMIQTDRFGTERGLFEFFATTAEYLGHPVYPSGTGGLTSDVCYDNPFMVRGVGENYQPNYQIWRTWGVYLHQQFRAGPGIDDDLIRAWNRNHPPGDPMTAQRDLRSLPFVLESPAYDKLGCATGCNPGFKGQYRLQELNNRIAVARWVDEPNFQPGWLPFDWARPLGILPRF